MAFPWVVTSTGPGSGVLAMLIMILDKAELSFSTDTVLHTVQINFHTVDVNKDRYIQTPIGLLIF